MIQKNTSSGKFNVKPPHKRLHLAIMAMAVFTLSCQDDSTANQMDSGLSQTDSIINDSEDENIESGFTMDKCNDDGYCGSWGGYQGCLDERDTPYDYELFCGGTENLSCPDGFVCLGGNIGGYCLTKCNRNLICPETIQRRFLCYNLNTCDGRECNAIDPGVCLRSVHPPEEAVQCKDDRDCDPETSGCFALYPPRVLQEDTTGFCFKLCSP